MNRAAENQPWVVRRAADQDAAEIARIYNHYVDSGESTFDNTHWTVPQTAALLAPGNPDAPSAGPPNGWFVAAENDQTLGWASARRYSVRFGYRFSCESAIYLDPRAVGLGVGDALQRRIEQHCLTHNIHHAVARIIADNARSIAFHQRHGYQLVGIQKEIGRVDDQWVDVAILQKIFSK